MKKLDNPQVGVRPGDSYPLTLLNAFGNIKLKALKAAKAIAFAAGGITTSLVLGTTSLASTNAIGNSTDNNSVTDVQWHTRLQQNISTKRYVINQTMTPFNAPQFRRTASIKALGGNTEKVRQKGRTPGKVSYGRLTLVNDTPSPKLIYLIPPMSAIPKRYAYVSGCTKRQLTSEYSTGWRFTYDKSKWTDIKKVPRDGQLEARVSRLSSHRSDSCDVAYQVEELIRARETAKPIKVAPRYTVVPATYSPYKHVDKARYQIVDGTGWVLNCLKNNKSSCDNMFITYKQPWLGEAPPLLIDRSPDGGQCFKNISCTADQRNLMLLNVQERNAAIARVRMRVLLMSMSQSDSEDQIAEQPHNERERLIDALIVASRYKNSYDQAIEWLYQYVTKTCGLRYTDARYQALIGLWQSLHQSNLQLTASIYHMGHGRAHSNLVASVSSPRTDGVNLLGDYLRQYPKCNLKERSPTHEAVKVVSYKRGIQ